MLGSVHLNNIDLKIKIRVLNFFFGRELNFICSQNVPFFRLTLKICLDRIKYRWEGD